VKTSREGATCGPTVAAMNSTGNFRRIRRAVLVAALTVALGAASTGCASPTESGRTSGQLDLEKSAPSASPVREPVLEEGLGQAPAASPSTDPGSAGPTPPAVMAEHSVDGAVAAVQHFLDLEREAYDGGSVAELEAMSWPECTECWARIDLIAQARAGGLKILGGSTRVELERRVPADELLAPEDLDPEADRDIYHVVLRAEIEDTTTQQGDITQFVPGQEFWLDAMLYRAPDGRWYAVRLAERW
jgi:hypothetical protein